MFIQYVSIQIALLWRACPLAQNIDLLNDFQDVTLTSQLVQIQCESVLYVRDTAVNVVVNVAFNFAFKP